MTQSQSRTGQLWKVVVVLICVGMCPLSSDAQTVGQPVSQSRPLWSIAAKQVGYESLSADFNFKVGGFGGDVVRVQFLDDQQLALAWVKPDQPAKPAGRLIHVPSHLHLKVLDARARPRFF